MYKKTIKTSTNTKNIFHVVVEWWLSLTN